MDPRTFYVMFIITFTILSFMIGAAVATMAMSANSNPPGGEEPEGAGSH